MRTTIKITLRIIAFPFVAVIIGIAMIRNYVYNCWNWLSKSGELITHDETFNPKTIREQVEELKQLVKEIKEYRNQKIELL